MDRTGENLVTDRLQSPPRGIKVKSRWLSNILTFFVVFGPGLIVMEADNDAGAVSTYTQAGGQYGLHLLWLMLLLLPVCYFIQEMVVRLGMPPTESIPALCQFPLAFRSGGRMLLPPPWLGGVTLIESVADLLTPPSEACTVTVCGPSSAELMLAT